MALNLAAMAAKIMGEPAAKSWKGIFPGTIPAGLGHRPGKNRDCFGQIYHSRKRAKCRFIDAVYFGINRIGE
jgi:hypothetical protein